MALQVIKAPSPEALARALNGVVLSKKNLIQGRDVRPNPSTTPGEDFYRHPVNGLTLIFATPAGTVTFSGNLTWKEIIDEINTALSADVAHGFKTDPNGGMVLALWDDTTPVTLLDTGTANSYFGFSTTAGDDDLEQTPVAAGDIISIHPDPLSKQWIAFIDV